MIEKKSYREIVDTIISNLEKRSQLTDFSVGSVTRTFVEAISIEIARLYDEIENAYDSGFIDTAQGKSLDLVVALLGLTRKSAQFATGTVTFTRANPSREVTIPVGTRVSTRSLDSGKVKLFETVEIGHLPRGQRDVDVRVRALFPGEDGIADFDTITELESPIVGVDSVTNKKPTTFGTDRESDEELRLRAKSTILSAGKVTIESMRNAILAIPGVRSVTVLEMPHDIPGEIDIIIDGIDLDDRTTYTHVMDVVNKNRPIGIKVNVKSTTIVRVYVEIFVKLKSEEDVTVEIMKVVSEYLSSLDIGEPIIRNKLISSILSVKEVYNVDDVNIITKVFDEKFGGLIEDTRKRLDPRTLNINLGNYERIRIEDVRVYTQYTPKVVSYVDCDFKIEILLAHKFLSKTKVKENIETAINIYLGRLKVGENIDYNAILNIINNIEGVGEVREFSIDVLHEDSGVIITDAKTTIEIGDFEIPKLRSINIETYEREKID
jgi:uncharacterized phage protein gp47/JayE